MHSFSWHITPMKDILLYWRNSIADAGRLSPADSDLRDAHDREFHLSHQAFADGAVEDSVTTALFKHWSETHHSQDKDGEEPQTIDALLCPLIFVPLYSHGVEKRNTKQKILAPLRILAKLSREGKLTIPAHGAKPQINRDFLEPADNDYIIGTVDNADAFYAGEPAPSVDWRKISKYIDKLIKSVSDKDYNDLIIEQTMRLDHGLILIPNIPKIPQAIIEGYDRLIESNETPDLLSLLTEGTTENGVLDNRAQLEVSARHLGQMGQSFPLTVSQRESLAHFLHTSDDKPDILAVNGPPGTGKTTLIQSVVAALWVEAALKNNRPPVIVAAAATNKAATNIIDAFAGAEPDASNPLSGRWLADVNSLGMYMPSRSADKGRRQAYLSADDHFAKPIETEEGLDRNLKTFLVKFNAAFPDNQTDDLETAKAHLHERLTKVCGGISEIVSLVQELDTRIKQSAFSLPQAVAHFEMMRQTIDDATVEAADAKEQLAKLKSLQLSWMEHLNTEPFLISLLAFLPPIQARRTIRDYTFMITKATESENSPADAKMSRSAFEAYLTTATVSATETVEKTKNRKTKLQQEFDTYKDALDQLTIWANDRDVKDRSLQGILASLDLIDRHEAFLLTMHYWEASYLLEVEKNLTTKYEDKKSPEKLMRLFQRLAKLSPCFASTFHMLPKHFTAWRRGNEQWDSVQLLGEIDLLVTDEAGQAAPEASALSFAFAKRALVVGDVKQIQPIRQIPEAIDRANVKRFLKISGNEYDEFRKRGLSADGGSLMTMAQKACRYTKFPELSQGMFLYEHFRCLDDIIAYCNTLCYDNRLIPRRGKLQSPHPLPAMGFANIDGADQKSGGSRFNQQEANVIAAWVKERRDQLEAHYNGSSISALLGILAPFAAQAQALRKALKQQGLPVADRGKQGITVGTLHALQGAERKIVLFSPTYGRDHKGNTFFGKNPELLNVAVSRAQDSFLVFGNMRLFDRHAPDRASSLLGSYLLDPDNEITDIQPVAPTPMASPPKVLISDLDSHRQALADSFAMAETHVAIVSPFLSEVALNADNIDEQIRKTTARGVRVSVYADRHLTRPADKLQTCVNRLSHAGADVFLSKETGVHSKLLWADKKYFVVGSFNWLSASRANNMFKRYEVSAVYQQDEASPLIEQVAKEIDETCEKLD